MLIAQQQRTILHAPVLRSLSTPKKHDRGFDDRRSHVPTGSESLTLLSFRESNRPCKTPRRSVTRPSLILVLSTFVAFSCKGADDIVLPDMVNLSTITVDSVTPILERGARDTLTATTVDAGGKKVSVPVVWRSSNEKVAVFERGGTLVALDTGVTAIVATSLGVVSNVVGVRVVWFGPAKIAAGSWARKNAAGPNGIVSDSLRVVVTNVNGAPVANAKVAFTVTEGGGTASPSTAVTGANGIAAARWTLGLTAGANTVTASVVRDDGSLNPFVTANLVSFSLNSYNALVVEAGNDQTAQILSDLPIVPSVKLVDSVGAPRPGVPVVFAAFSNGRVVTPVVSTDANGVAAPGKWTLGDIPGEQILEATVEDARVFLRATGTGTPIHYRPAGVVAGGNSACARENDGSVKCWGQAPQVGTGGKQNVFTPTPVQGSLTASSLAGGSSHYCAVTASGGVSCWGVNALVDTSGQSANASAPTALPSDIVWAQISSGFAHNCGISTGQTTYCWGANASGQLGDLTTTNHFVPALVTGGFQFSSVSSGTNHTCGLTVGGSVFCWGGNQLGQIGDGTTTTRTSPTAVAGAGNTFQTIGAGDGMSCALSTQGRVYCWGGLSAGPAQATPITYPNAPTFASLSVGGAHACALTADGTAYCWGSNTFGQLGDSSTTSRSPPTPVAGGLRFEGISAGFTHTCGRTTDGSVACWGRNVAGELGENQSAFRLTPRYIVLGVDP